MSSDRVNTKIGNQLGDDGAEWAGPAAEGRCDLEPRGPESGKELTELVAEFGVVCPYLSSSSSSSLSSLCENLFLARF